TVTVAVPRSRSVNVTPDSTSPKVFDSRSNVPLKPLTVNWAFCPACAVWTASAVSSWVTVTVLVAPVARLTTSSRKSGLDAVPRFTAEAVTPASSALMELASPASGVVASTATLCTVAEPTWNWNGPGPLATGLDADATPTVAPATEPCARSVTVSVTLPGWAPAPAAAANTSVSLDV